jgi:hypothetical protein
MGVLANKPETVLDGLSELLEMGFSGAHFGVAVGSEGVLVQVPSCQLYLLEIVLLIVQEEPQKVVKIFENLFITHLPQLIAPFS